MPRNVTRREKLFGALVFLAVASALAGVVHWVRLHIHAQGGKVAELTISLLYGLLSALIIALVALAFKPFQEWLEGYIRVPDGTGNELRILLFGQTGCGKTSFAYHLLTISPLMILDATPDFTPRPGTLTLPDGRTVPGIFGDYRGEEPSQATLNIPEDFAGSRKDRLVDVLNLFADFIGRERDPDNPDQILDNERLLDWVLEAPQERVDRRLNQHKTYISAPILEILFSAIYTPGSRRPRLRRVGFAITKADLIKEAARRGTLGLNEANLRDEVLSCFEDVIARINAACMKNQIPPCIVELISVKDESARRFAIELLGPLFPGGNQ